MAPCGSLPNCSPCDSTRTRHSYYRAMLLVHEHFGTDPATLGEDQFRDCLLHVKTRKGWKPKTIRQTAACARLFFESQEPRGRRRLQIKGSSN
jgi:hypothetical protein